MTIKAIYDTKDFFGRIVMREDVNNSAGIKDLQKCFTALKKDRNFAIHLDSDFVIAWDGLNDFENEIVLVRTYHAWNQCEDQKMSFSKAKKSIIDYYKAKQAA